MARAKVGGHGSSLPASRNFAPSSCASRSRVLVHFNSEFQWFSLGHHCRMLGSAYENKGFVNVIFESIARNAVRLVKYQEFAISCYSHQVEMSESTYKSKGLVNFMFKSISIIAIRLMKF